jgi:hypothetical protein
MRASKFKQVYYLCFIFLFQKTKVPWIDFFSESNREENFYEGLRHPPVNEAANINNDHEIAQEEVHEEEIETEVTEGQVIEDEVTEAEVTEAEVTEAIVPSVNTANDNQGYVKKLKAKFENVEWIVND